MADGVERVMMKMEGGRDCAVASEGKALAHLIPFVP
jgi:hypothetical protein